MTSTNVRIGVDLGGTKLEAIALSEDGETLFRKRAPTPQGDYAGTVAAVAALVERLERELLPGPERGTLPVGVGTPGAVSPATGLLKNSNSVCLNGRPLEADLARALGRPVRLANDANCFALSEATDGAARDARVTFGVILGTGVGGGLVVRPASGGAPWAWAGRNAIAGEWGHNPMPWPRDDERADTADACYCGRHGCIETYLSGPGLTADHARRSGERLDAPTLAASSAAGAPNARASFDRYFDRLARALASVVNLLDPDVLVLGGGLSNLPGLPEAVRARWGAYVFSDRVDTALRTARHGDSSGVRGAAWLWSVAPPIA